MEQELVAVEEVVGRTVRSERQSLTSASTLISKSASNSLAVAKVSSPFSRFLLFFLSPVLPC
jgi:hypothetical protein